MSVGLLAVVDDILSAALKASAKSAGVVIDDAAVTPQYVQGLSPARELPVVGRIALGSLANKFLIIIPIAMLLTAFAPWVLPWLLIVGGAYLCFEGAEKVLEWFGFHHGGHDGDEGGRDEASRPRRDPHRPHPVDGDHADRPVERRPDLDFWSRVAVLAVIALAMTALVYGAVALLVKLDDIGLKMAKSGSARVRHTGMRIVRSMPAVFRVISIVGTVAMLWVGGHLVLANLGEVGWHAPVDLLHAVEHALEPAGPVVVWFGDTLVSADRGCAHRPRDRRDHPRHRQGVRAELDLQRGARTRVRCRGSGRRSRLRRLTRGCRSIRHRPRRARLGGVPTDADDAHPAARPAAMPLAESSTTMQRAVRPRGARRGEERLGIGLAARDVLRRDGDRGSAARGIHARLRERQDRRRDERVRQAAERRAGRRRRDRHDAVGLAVSAASSARFSARLTSCGRSGSSSAIESCPCRPWMIERVRGSTP
jgi:predicted DNA repair protein MutK